MASQFAVGLIFDLFRTLCGDDPRAVLQTAKRRLGDAHAFSEVFAREAKTLPITADQVSIAHSDTDGIASESSLSIPLVSHAVRCAEYAQRMDKKAWGAKFRAAIKAKEIRPASLAEKLDISDAGLRHWLNGTRPPTLWQFFTLCELAGVNPQAILFDPPSESDLAAARRLLDQFNPDSKPAKPEKRTRPLSSPQTIKNT